MKRIPCGHILLALGTGVMQLALAQDPIITLQPIGRTVLVGGNVSLLVRATTTNSPLAFQWQRDDPTAPLTFTNIPSATRGALNLLNLTFEQAGDYRVIVSNAVGASVTSEVAHLAVVNEPFTKITEGAVVTNRANFFTGTWADINNDGFSDLLVMAGSDVLNHAPALYRNVSGTNFVQLTAEAVGDAVAPNGGWNYQGLWGDFDNDGLLDLLQLSDLQSGTNYISTNRFFWGQGDYAFQLVTDDIGLNRLPIGPWQNALVDFDNDGFLDVYFTTGWSSWGPGTRDMLYRNNRDGTFSHVWSPTGIIFDTQFGCWADYDNDGDLDVWITGKRNFSTDPSNYGELYRNEGNGNFTPVTSPTIPMIRHFYGAWGDYDNDGYLDLINSNVLFRNDQHGGFAVVSQTFVSGGLQMWGDYDNDGNLDFVTGRWGTPPAFYHNRGDGTFEEVNVGSPSVDIPAGESLPTWCDYDNDGFLDLHVSTRGNPSGPNYLYRNNGAAAGFANHWLTVKPVGTVSSRSPVGVKVRVLANIRGNAIWQLRQISGVYYDDLRAHFGLGDATIVDTLRIEWPSGTVQELRDVSANLILTVTEPPRLIPQSAGSFQIQCWVNQSFDVQCSSDLATWTPVTTVTNETGTLVFEDLEADQHECRYYRVVEARPNMVWIPAGTFLMGSPEDEVD
jgi:enediyne biosynthesis protein E4